MSLHVNIETAWDSSGNNSCTHRDTLLQLRPEVLYTLRYHYIYTLRLPNITQATILVHIEAHCYNLGHKCFTLWDVITSTHWDSLTQLRQQFLHTYRHNVIALAPILVHTETHCYNLNTNSFTHRDTLLQLRPEVLYTLRYIYIYTLRQPNTTQATISVHIQTHCYNFGTNSFTHRDTLLTPGRQVLY